LKIRLGAGYYKAPELYQEKYDGPTEPADIFAMGVILFTLVENKFPFTEFKDFWY
jgi:hypothetical protein